MNAFCILLVEDDENDVFFMKRAFDLAGINKARHVVAMDSRRFER